MKIFWAITATITVLLGIKMLRRRSVQKNCKDAVGKKVALVSPTVSPEGEVSLRFMIGDFDLMDQEFFLRIPDGKAVNIPGPFLVRLKSNPEPEMFDGAEFLLRVDEAEVIKFPVYEPIKPDSQTPIH